MYTTKTPAFIPAIAQGFTWNLKDQNEKPTLFLTFDDGPIPSITPWVLDLLDQFNAQGTFFCVGDNIRKHTDIHREILERGHTTGNHTFNHYNGWKTSHYSYLKNVIKSSEFDETRLFRPPYGKLTKKQASTLSKRFQLIMWDVLTGDFDQNLSPQLCAERTIKATESGSILVFHDSIKAEPRLKYALPKVLQHFAQLGFEFKAVPTQQPKIIDVAQ